RSVTCLTASILNSSVYRLPLMLTSSVAINYGSKMSTKGWPVHASGVGRPEIAVQHSWWMIDNLQELQHHLCLSTMVL
ncbi:hypothetical protein K6W76_30845, partial [Burkholderia anthina]|uniref:hypothetical protein n=1 Tax=Burkholderia anthina TaxID=179879 RepID=UPI001ABAB0C5